MPFDSLAAVAELPGAAAALLAFRTGGQLHATIIAKATFAFASDASMTRVDPQPILRSDVYDGNNPLRSPRFTSDIVPYLQRADVLLTGHGYAQAAGPAHVLAARLSIYNGERSVLDKTILLQDPAGFQRIPIVYERAFGGPDIPDNPIGVGASPGTDEPTIVHPSDPKRPAGFGPIARAWPARKRLLGATPRRTLEQPIAEIPAGFDSSYFQAAPPDQRIDFLRGDEWIVLEGLHPSLPRLSTRLPGARGVARLYGLAAFGVPEGQPLDLRIDTLRIDSDEQVCTVVCRAWIPLTDEAALAALRVTAGVLSAGENVEWPEPPPPIIGMASKRAEEAPRAFSATLALPDGQDDAAPRRTALPFFAPPRAISSFRTPDRLTAPSAPHPNPIPPPPPISPILPPTSVVAASNAAASLPENIPALYPGLGPTAARAESAAPKRAIDLLFFDPRSLPRIRKNPAWRRILEELQDKPPDPDIDDPDLGIEPAAAEERREIFEVLAHGEALGEEALRSALPAAIREDGRFVPPHVLLEGELSLSFDVFETLKATVAVVGPMGGGNDQLEQALGAAKEFLKALDPLSDPVAAKTLYARLEEAHGKGKHALPFAEVAVRVERVLLGNRRYQRQAVFGGRYLRGSLRPKGTEATIPVYLPETLADVLPMFSRLIVRVLAEAHWPVDEHEVYPTALRGVAIARVV